MIPQAFTIHALDNVATLIDDAPTGTVQCLGARAGEVNAIERIARGHKIALCDIPAGDAVIKFGVRIGCATQSIPRGAWVHLHNLASDLDQRSSSLDLHSGAPSDTSRAYV